MLSQDWLQKYTILETLFDGRSSRVMWLGNDHKALHHSRAKPDIALSLSPVGSVTTLAPLMAVHSERHESTGAARGGTDERGREADACSGVSLWCHAR